MKPNARPFLKSKVHRYFRCIEKQIFASLTIAGLFVLIAVQSCNIINPEEEVPSYIEIPAFKVTSNYATQGTNSSKITDVWVYAGGAYIGTYELPARFPLLLAGEKEITFGAGIMANGIASTRESYPFYRFHTADLNLIPGKVTSLDTISVDYFPDLQYVWFEDLEKDTSGGGISMDTTAASQVNILPDSVVVFEGKRSLRFQVLPSTSYLECTMVGDGYPLPPGRDVYLELNYKCNQPFNMGLIARTFSGDRKVPVIRFNTKPDWNKIYVRLGPYVNANGDAFRFKVYFEMNLESGLSEGTAYLDNLKLMIN